MIDVAALNRQLVEQDHALRERFAQIVEGSGADPAQQTLLELISEGLAAIHERQGNAITLMVRTNS